MGIDCMLYALTIDVLDSSHPMSDPSIEYYYLRDTKIRSGTRKKNTWQNNYKTILNGNRLKIHREKDLLTSGRMGTSVRFSLPQNTRFGKQKHFPCSKSEKNIFFHSLSL